MISSIQRKLKSQQGASLLLALLFVLLCSTIAASILMAAVSNAGKHQSNLEENQRYLALSSAVSLLCDEITQATYQGCYQYTTTSETVTVDGVEETITKHHLEQLDGTYTGQLEGLLLANLDALFAREIRNSSAEDDFDTIKTLPEADPTHALVLSTDTGTALDEWEVKVELTVVDSYAIELTAQLMLPEEEASGTPYQIRAELTPIRTKPTLTARPETTGTYFTDSMAWKIGWITTGTEEDAP